MRQQLLCLEASPETSSTCITRRRRRSTYQDSIISAWFPTSLGVTKCCDASVKPKSVMKNILDVIRTDVVKLGVYGPLRYDNNSLPLADLPMLSS